MSYEQVRTIVKQLADKHRQASDACHEIDLGGPTSRYDLLLEHFEAWQADVHTQMQVDDANERAEVLETWIQYIPMEPVDAALDRLRKAEGEAKLEPLLDFHRATTDLLDTLAEQVNSEKVKAFLQNLIEAEQTFSRQCSTTQDRKNEI